MKDTYTHVHVASQQFLISKLVDAISMSLLRMRLIYGGRSTRLVMHRLW